MIESGDHLVKKKIFLTGLLMLGISCFVIRIVDNTVQIDGDYVYLFLLLLMINGMIVYFARKIL